MTSRPDDVAGLPERRAARPLSGVLADLAREDVTRLSDLVGMMGSRAHGTALLLLALPEAIPLPVPSVSSVLGVPLIVVAAHLILFGEGSELPRRVGEWRVPARLMRLLSHRIAPILARAERVSHPRWERVAGRERLIGVLCLYLSLVLLLPLPLVNTPPALCIVLLAWGMIQRDGAFAIAGAACAAVMTLALGGAAFWMASLLKAG
jgi:hypothetical protein